MFLECQRRQLDDDVGEGDRGCRAGAGHRLELLPQVDQVGGVDGRRERHAGGDLCTLDHPLGDRSANRGDGNLLVSRGRNGLSGSRLTNAQSMSVLGPRRGCRARGCGRVAAPLQSDRIDAQLACDAPGARGDARLRRVRARFCPSHGFHRLGRGLAIPGPCRRD